MLRAALWALLVVSALGVSLQAQRARAAFHDTGPTGRPVRSGSVQQRGSATRLLRSHSRNHRDLDNPGSFFFPYGEPFGDEQPEAEGNEMALPSATLQSRGPASEPRAHKPLVIEIPGAASLAPAKVAPPTIFILANGERLETRRFVLTASNLSINIDRQQRTVPTAMLDINATINANRDRGIDLRVPYDRNEISLSF
jgi:hypothetical protein